MVHSVNSSWVFLKDQLFFIVRNTLKNFLSKPLELSMLSHQFMLISAVFRGVFESHFLLYWLSTQVLKILLYKRFIDYVCRYLRYREISSTYYKCKGHLESSGSFFQQGMYRCPRYSYLNSLKQEYKMSPIIKT